MKRILRLGDGYALTKHKLKPFKKRYIGLLAVLTSMCLYAQAQAPASGVAAPAALGRDTSDISRDTLQIEEVEINAGYYTTTKRFNTGSISRIGATEIARQPVSNPLAALQGRVPGLVITSFSGVPGGTFSVEIRGRTTLAPNLSSNEPLYVIDGVPFAPGNQRQNQLRSAANNPVQASQGGISPLNNINPADIQSIEVLKDADATAIYGSRGANGVILITTKRVTEGQSKWHLNISNGMAKALPIMELLNTEQYVAMRKEGYANDGLTPTDQSAPDILVWDTTRYTDWKDVLIGGTARTQNYQLGMSGGLATTQFRLNGGFYKETSVYPGDLGYRRASVQFNAVHRHPGERYSVSLQTNYSTGRNDLNSGDLTQFIGLPPNFPAPFNENGSLKFSEGGIPYSSLGITNPFTYLDQLYQANSETMVSQISFQYRVMKRLRFIANTGYNLAFNDERLAVPSTSYDPARNILPSASFANSRLNSWIAEPQLAYSHSHFGGMLTMQLGGTWQSVISRSNSMVGTNYANDLLLNSISAAGQVVADNAYSIYRYQALFGRVNYRLSDKYVINISGRRDGSSRFGPSYRYATFAAVGAAWIFSSEPIIEKAMPWINFGKLRGSFGIAGNDQIGNYLYLDSWQPTRHIYGGGSGLSPARLFNPDYRWEETKKMEFALEMGLFENRVLLTAAWYRHRSGNQLIAYQLPRTTGFAAINRNLDALVQNTGAEVSLETKPINRRLFTWQAALTLSIPRNKLLAFPGLENSSYSNDFAIGHPLNIRKSHHLAGVNAVTGTYEYQDMDGDGKLTVADRTRFVNTDVRWHGGISNSFTFRRFQLDIFVEFRRQLGNSLLANFTASNLPGRMHNQYVAVFQRWQKEGDVADIQKFSATAGSEPYNASNNLAWSDGYYADASYARIKNVAVNYNLPPTMFGVSLPFSGQLMVQAQNLFTFTGYQGSDPETQAMKRLPPLRVLNFGINLQF